MRDVVEGVLLQPRDGRPSDIGISGRQPFRLLQLMRNCVELTVAVVADIVLLEVRRPRPAPSPIELPISVHTMRLLALQRDRAVRSAWQVLEVSGEQAIAVTAAPCRVAAPYRAAAPS